MEQRIASPYAGSSVKLVVGLFLTALGLVLTLDNLDIIEAHQYLHWAPAVLVVIGLVKLSDPTSRGVATVLIVAGTLLTAWSVSWIEFSIFDLWPLIIIGFGVVIVLQTLGFRTQGSTLDPTAPKILSIFGNRKESITTHDFRGGRIIAFLSSIELDLTTADIEHGPAVLELVVFMAGVELKVPEGWEVVGDALPIMGGIEIKNKARTKATRQLVVRGLIMWGGVEVKTA